jgi:hypothetical protein
MSANVKALRQVLPDALAPNLMIGTVCAVQNGLPAVQCFGSEDQYILHRSLQHALVSGTPAVGTQVLFLCEDRKCSKAILIGVLVNVEPMLRERTFETATRTTCAQLDGQRIVLEAEQEIVLRCGKGSLTLTADGRIVMKGVEITSRAQRTHKIRGAVVNIN